MLAVAAAPPPVRDRVRARMPADVQGLVPDALLDSRVAGGTIASQFDRTLSVRIEGDGPASTRTIVPQTTTAERALASPAGPAIERLVRRTMAVGDAWEGRENLRSITLVPDEHALQAVEVLGYVVDDVRRSGEPATFTDGGTPAQERAAAQAFTREVASEVLESNANTLAWNADGEMVVMPDVSRRLLATIDAYQLRPGDDVSRASATRRDEILRDDWDTLLHEASHSVTPERHDSSDAANVWEEAIPTVIARRDRSNAARQAGADIGRIATDPTSGRDDAQLGWASWSRSRMPAPTQEERDEAHAVYGDGPEALRDLLGLAGIDRRTTEGRERTIELLQGRAARYVPRRVADAIMQERSLDASLREPLVRRVRDSLLHPEGARLVTDWLDEVAPQG